MPRNDPRSRLFNKVSGISLQKRHLARTRATTRSSFSLNTCNALLCMLFYSANTFDASDDNFFKLALRRWRVKVVITKKDSAKREESTMLHCRTGEIERQFGYIHPHETNPDTTGWTGGAFRISGFVRTRLSRQCLPSIPP